MVHAHLARLIVACDAVRATVGRLGERAKAALQPGGALSFAADAAAGIGGGGLHGTDYFKKMTL